MARRQRQARAVPVTLRGLMQRINRKLAAKDERLHATRGDRPRRDLGNYYVVNLRQNHVTRIDVDPETLGRELGVLRAWEQLVKEVQ